MTYGLNSSFKRQLNNKIKYKGKFYEKSCTFRCECNNV